MNIEPMSLETIRDRRDSLHDMLRGERSTRDIQRELAMREAIDCLASSTRSCEPNHPSGNLVFAARCIHAAQKLSEFL